MPPGKKNFCGKYEKFVVGLVCLTGDGGELGVGQSGAPMSSAYRRLTECRLVVGDREKTFLEKD